MCYYISHRRIRTCAMLFKHLNSYVPVSLSRLFPPIYIHAQRRYLCGIRATWRCIMNDIYTRVKRMSNLRVWFIESSSCYRRTTTMIWNLLLLLPYLFARESRSGESWYSFRTFRDRFAHVDRLIIDGLAQSLRENVPRFDKMSRKVWMSKSDSARSSFLRFNLRG